MNELAGSTCWGVDAAVGTRHVRLQLAQRLQQSLGVFLIFYHGQTALNSTHNTHTYLVFTAVTFVEGRHGTGRIPYKVIFFSLALLLSIEGSIENGKNYNVGAKSYSCFIKLSRVTDVTICFPS